MSSAHTKGPWIAKAGDTFDGDIAITTEGRLSGSMVEIAAIRTDWDEPFASEQRANVQLISSAPDLLAALQAVLDDCPDLDMVSSNEPGRDKGPWSMATEAIAKATGSTA